MRRRTITAPGRLPTDLLGKNASSTSLPALGVGSGRKPTAGSRSPRSLLLVRGSGRRCTDRWSIDLDGRVIPPDRAASRQVFGVGSRRLAGRVPIGLLKYALVAAFAASVAFAPARSDASQRPKSQPPDTRVVVARPGDLLQVLGVDLSCRVYRHDPAHQEIGPLMYCDRTSAPKVSHGLGVSKWNYFISPGNDKYRTFRVSRSP